MFNRWKERAEKLCCLRARCGFVKLQVPIIDYHPDSMIRRVISDCNHTVKNQAKFDLGVWQVAYVFQVFSASSWTLGFGSRRLLKRIGRNSYNTVRSKMGWYYPGVQAAGAYLPCIPMSWVLKGPLNGRWALFLASLP